MGKRWVGNTFIYLIIFVAVIAIFFTLFSSGESAERTGLTTILDMANNEEIEKIVVDGDRLIVTPRQNPNQLLMTEKEPGTSVFEILQAANINPTEKSIQIEVKRSSSFGSIWSISSR